MTKQKSFYFIFILNTLYAIRYTIPMSSVKVKRIFFLSFLFSLHIAISAYVNSSFLSTFFQDWFIGILYSIASVITLYLLSESTALLKNFGNRTLAIILLFFNIASLFGLISAKNSYFAALSFIVFFITNSLTYFCVDIFIEHFGNPKNIGKTRSMYLMIVNLGWLVAPFISGYLIGKGSGGYQIIYLYSLYIVVLMMFLFLFAVPPFKDRTYTKTPFLETYQFLKTNKHIFAISAINFILQFFFVWMVIYTPIYLHEFLKFNWTQIGIIFTIMLAPFVLFGLPIGILIDKFHFHKR